MFKHFLQTTFVRLISMALIFIQSVFVARFLLPEGKGVIALYLGVINMIMPLSYMGVKQSSAFFLGKKTLLNKINNYQNITILFSTLLALVILLIVLTSQKLTNSNIIVLLAFSIPFNLFNTFKLSYALYNRDIEKINISNLITSFAQFSLNILLILTNKLSTELFFLNYLISHILASFYNFTWLRRASLLKFNFSFSLYFKHCPPYIIKGIFYALPLFTMGLNYKVDYLILKRYVDDAQVGIYSVGVNLAELIWLLPQIFSLIIFSYSVSSNDRKEFSRSLIQKTKRIMLYSLLAIIISLYPAKFLFSIVYGEIYNDSYISFLYLLPGIYFMIAFKTLNGDLAARGFPLIAFWVFSLALIVNITFNLILIPKMGINGAAIASTISYIFGSGLFIYKYYKMTFRIK